MPNKIAIITSHPIQYQAPLFRALAAEPDIDVTVFFGSNHGVSAKVDPGFGRTFAWDVPLLEGYRYVFLKNSRPGISVNDWRLDGKELKTYFEQERYDAIVVFGWNKVLFWQAIWWGRRYELPLILRGESNLEHAQAWGVRAAKSVLFPLLFKQFKAFLAIGSLNAGLYRHFGVSEKKVFLAPYCVDNEFFAARAVASVEKARLLRQDLGIQEGDTVFLFMAKLIDRKRPLDLIHANASLNHRRDIHTIIVGDGPLFGECELLGKQSGSANIHLVGFKNQTELPLYYAAADVLVLPSEYETWGLVVNEAMACGLPCIVSDSCGCAPDMIVAGETGYTYPCGDVGSLANAMILLSGNRARMHAMGEAARSQSRNFGIDKTVTALKDALRCVHEG
ncbi:MAG: glycosyltransferase family 1 protein [Desulforudis sp.]|nr:MAG: glycosyltransferase family 1 protein [Desulforudis sp.]